ncbi:unnamed protein product [Clavelina lepadiformis]|uniref:Uncharacterized protein n=1 Tax=Clavelina lepadiformis TaxID=159417 RepID=A0ABP0GZ22_CLALP
MLSTSAILDYSLETELNAKICLKRILDAVEGFSELGLWKSQCTEKSEVLQSVISYKQGLPSGAWPLLHVCQSPDTPNSPSFREKGNQSKAKLAKINNDVVSIKAQQRTVKSLGIGNADTDALLRVETVAEQVLHNLVGVVCAMDNILDDVEHFLPETSQPSCRMSVTKDLNRTRNGGYDCFPSEFFNAGERAVDVDSVQEGSGMVERGSFSCTNDDPENVTKFSDSTIIDCQKSSYLSSIYQNPTERKLCPETIYKPPAVEPVAMREGLNISPVSTEQKRKLKDTPCDNESWFNFINNKPERKRSFSTDSSHYSKLNCSTSGCVEEIHVSDEELFNDPYPDDALVPVDKIFSQKSIHSSVVPEKKSRESSIFMENPSNILDEKNEESKIRNSQAVSAASVCISSIGQQSELQQMDISFLNNNFDDMISTDYVTTIVNQANTEQNRENFPLASTPSEPKNSDFGFLAVPTISSSSSTDSTRAKIGILNAGEENTTVVKARSNESGSSQGQESQIGLYPSLSPIQHDSNISNEDRCIHENISEREGQPSKKPTSMALVNIASGQLIMSCPSLDDIKRRRIVEWRPWTWKNEGFAVSSMKEKIVSPEQQALESVDEHEASMTLHHDNSDGVDDGLSPSVVTPCVRPQKNLSGFEDQILPMSLGSERKWSGEDLSPRNKRPVPEFVDYPKKLPRLCQESSSESLYVNDQEVPLQHESLSYCNELQLYDTNDKCRINHDAHVSEEEEKQNDKKVMQDDGFEQALPTDSFKNLQSPPQSRIV